MSYANMDGVPTQTAGTSEVLASDWNTYVRDNFDSIKFGHIVVSNDAARTGLSVGEGTMVYQTDNQKLYVYSGSVWVEVLDLDRTGAIPETSPGHLIVADNTAKSALTATEGMMVYQSDNDKVFVYSGSAWVEVGSVKTPSGATGQSIDVRPPFAGVARSQLTINTGSLYVVSWDAGSSNDGMWTSGTDVVIKTAGLYLITYYASIAATAGGVREVRIRTNGNVAAAESSTSTGGVVNDQFCVTTILSCNVNDAISADAVQNSGSNIGFAASMQVIRLGASS